jgi:hypothetical protein
VRADGAFVTPAFTLVLIFTGIVVMPTALYFYLAHEAWTWLYLVDPADVPDLAVVPVLVLHGGFLIGGWYLGARLLRTDRRRVAVGIAAGSIVMWLMLVLIGWRRVSSYGSYREFHDGQAIGLMSVKLGYVLIPLILGVGVSAVFIAFELIRDSRRVQAR